MTLCSDCSIVLSVERGKLESQSVLLVESLRRFGGAYSNCPVFAVSPRPSLQMGAACRDALKALGVQVIVEPLLSPDEAYGPIARLAACVWAERNLSSEIVVSLDDDLFFAGEPDFQLDGCDFFARPVDHKGICTSGSGDPFDDYWRRITQMCEIDYEEIPWLKTTIDRVLVKASYNGGMVAVRRDRGLFQAAERMFQILRKNNLSPRKPCWTDALAFLRVRGWNQIFASTGYVGVEASRWWGTSQAILSLAAVQLKARVTIAPPTYNVPAHLAEDAARRGRGVSLKDAVLVHYHWLLDKEFVKENSVLSGDFDLPEAVLQWLKSKTPLGETYS